jgi:hypothetical protein
LRVFRLMKLHALAACVAMAAACAHEDVTPAIAVQPGAAARAMALLGHGGPNDPHAAPAADAGDDESAETEPGSIAFSCVEPRGAVRALARVPCRVTIAELGAAPAAGEGPTELVFETGKVVVEAPPGKYRVTVSRGPEYALATWDIDVASGTVAWGPNEGAIALRRVVDTRGYLAVDFGAATEETVRADVAAGMEIVVGDVSLVAPIVQAAKLEDAIEPLSAGDLDTMDAWSNRDAFLARIASKHPVTAVAPPPARTYVRVDDDSSLVTWSPAREADVVRGLRDRRDVVMTTGPFVRVSANGAPIGGVARATADKDVEVKVHVECAPWIVVDRVSIVRASGPPVDSRPIVLRPTATDARAADVTFHLHAATDDAFVVLVDASALPESDSPATRAMTGAIWVDADGDGESLGRTAAPPKETKR